MLLHPDVVVMLQNGEKERFTKSAGTEKEEITTAKFLQFWNKMDLIHKIVIIPLQRIIIGNTIGDLLHGYIIAEGGEKGKNAL